jgi:hypothetical protein
VRVYVCVCVCTKKRVLKLIFVHAYIHTYAKFSMCNTLPSFFQYTCIEKGSMEVVNMQGNWDDRERMLPIDPPVWLLGYVLMKELEPTLCEYMCVCVYVQRKEF